MADTTFNTPEADNTPAEPMFEPYVFSRQEVNNAHLPGRAVMNFVNLTHDIVAGAKVVADLLEWDDGREDFCEQRLLSSNDRSKMRRLTSASLGLLLEECYTMRDWAYENHTEQGRKDVHDREMINVARHSLPASVPVRKSAKKAGKAYL